MAKKRKAEKYYLKQLEAAIDIIFTIAVDEFGWDWAELARQSGLSYSTVANLGNKETIFPEARSLILLSRAVGREFGINEKTGQVTLKKRKAA